VFFSQNDKEQDAGFWKSAVSGNQPMTCKIYKTCCNTMVEPIPDITHGFSTVDIVTCQCTTIRRVIFTSESKHNCIHVNIDDLWL